MKKWILFAVSDFLSAELEGKREEHSVFDPLLADLVPEMFCFPGKGVIGTLTTLVSMRWTEPGGVRRRRKRRNMNRSRVTKVTK